MHQLTREDYQNLLAFRTSLRRFYHWSQAQARTAGLTPARHQLLLAIKGHHPGHGPTIGDLAGNLLLRPHSAVELVDRAVRPGWWSGGAMTTTAASPASGSPPAARSG